MDNTQNEYYNKYMEYFNKYNELYEQYKIINEKYNLKAEKQRIASLKYFNNNTKSNTKHCDICNLEIKHNSYSNHIKSQKHLKCVEFQNQIKELQK